MAIAPIQGMLKKHLLTHLTIGITGGITCGYAYWYLVHIPAVQRRDQWYVKYQKEKDAAKDA